jgi:hypothetical protein
MRRILLLLILFASFAFSVDEKIRSEFLFAYHNGDYEQAHSLLTTAIQDPVSRQIWEERIHLQSNTISSCTFVSGQNKPAQGIAYLRIGDLQHAKESFESDWLSLLGLANLSWWQNDRNTARQYVQQALAIAPKNPEVLYVAGDYAPNSDLSIEMFTKFLAIPTEDPLRRQIAEYSIEFMKKTEGMDLNVPSLPSDFQPIESQFKNEGLLIKTKVNEKQKATLLLDTGVGGFTLQNEDWQPKLKTDMLLFGLGSTESTKSSRIVLERFDVGSFTLKNAVGALSYSFRGDGFQGIAGTALFSNYLILIPLKSGKDVILFNHCEKDALSCLEKHGIHFESHTTLPFQLVNKMIVVKGQIDKSEADQDILIDTGATNSLISASAAKRWAHVNYALSRQMNSNVVGMTGKTKQNLIAENVDLKIRPLSKTYNLITAVNLASTNESMQLELDFILGRDFLNGYSLLIDYRNLQITFLK